jgi:hypothetical protein
MHFTFFGGFEGSFTIVNGGFATVAVVFVFFFFNYFGRIFEKYKIENLILLDST